MIANFQFQSSRGGRERREGHKGEGRHQESPGRAGIRAQGVRILERRNSVNEGREQWGERLKTKHFSPANRKTPLEPDFKKNSSNSK